MSKEVSKTPTDTDGIFIVQRVRDLGIETIRQTETEVVQSTGEIIDDIDPDITKEIITTTKTIIRNSIHKIGV